MRPVTDTATVDLARTCVSLRPDLKFVPQRYGGHTWVHLETEATSDFYRVGFTEYVFLSLLDGSTTFAEALAQTARSQGANALTEHRAMSLYRWVLDEGLGDFADNQVSERRRQAGAQDEDLGQLIGRWNPFWLKLPLGRPDGFLNTVEPALGWLFSLPATLLGVGLMLISLFQILGQREQLEAAGREVLATDNWIWLLLAWVILKILHETAHGLVCRRYGGSVRDSGVIFAFLAPLAYVDVTSSWSFSSRWQRIHTALAGIYVELLTAALAVQLLLWTDSDQLAHLLYNIILMASLSTILFNANPLMRFDGYYVLSDLLQIPNLASRSSEVLRQVTQRLLFGIDSALAIETGGRRSVLLTYGVLAAVWKLIICASLLIAASVLFHGAGLLLAAAGVVAWFGVPLVRSLLWLQRVGRNSPARVIRATVLGGGAVAGLLTALLVVPVPVGATAPGIVELPDGSTVRAVTDGFVEQLHVVPGQQVAEGELLISMRNRELETEHADLQLQLEQAELRRRAALDNHDAADAQVNGDVIASLQTRLESLTTRTSGLQLRAEVAGEVVLPNMDLLRGRYVEEGQELLFIDDHQSRELHVSVSQEDQPTIRNLTGAPVRVRIGTRSSMHGLLERITPRATLRLRHPALAAPEGGQLAVTLSEDDEDYLLTEHRFDAVIQLPRAQASGLVAGERGYVSFQGASRSMADHVYRSVSGWLENQLAAAEQSRN